VKPAPVAKSRGAAVNASIFELPAWPASALADLFFNMCRQHCVEEAKKRPRISRAKVGCRCRNATIDDAAKDSAWVSVGVMGYVIQNRRYLDRNCSLKTRLSEVREFFA
jgi:hypothetical protein